MSIAPISSVLTSSVTPTSYVQVASPAASGEASGDFAATLASSVNGLQSAQSTASDLAIQAVSGDLEDVHDYTIAATEASLAMELTATIRNKAIDAFTEIMRMSA